MVGSDGRAVLEMDADVVALALDVTRPGRNEHSNAMFDGSRDQRA